MSHALIASDQLPSIASSMVCLCAGVWTDGEGRENGTGTDPGKPICLLRDTQLKSLPLRDTVSEHWIS